MRHPVLAVLLLIAAPAAASADAALERLRAENARHFTDPLTHLELARRHREEGRGLLAFDIAENLRRQSPKAFRAAFEQVFVRAADRLDDAEHARLLERFESSPEDPALAARLGRAALARGELDRAGELFTLAARLEPKRREHVERMAEVLNLEGLNAQATKLLQDWDAEHPDNAARRVREVQLALDAGELERAKSLVKDALAEHPGDCELYGQRGQLLAAEGKAREAERFFSRAAQLCPERARLHGQLASLSLLVLGDPVRGLDHYLDAYFADPNYDDGEYVDKRIRAISDSLAQAVVERRAGDCHDARCLAPLLTDPNPAVARLALGRAGAAWGPELERPLLSLLGHDDPDLRAGAMLLLAQSGGESLDLRLDALLASTDPRRLGMAAQLAVRLRGREGRAAAKKLLQHEDELVRFDALTALGLEGGPSGRVAAGEHAKDEKVPALRELARELGEGGS